MASTGRSARGRNESGSVLKAVLDHPPSQFHSLVLLQDSLVQSSVPVLREILARCLSPSSDPSPPGFGGSATALLVSVLRDPKLYLPNDASLNRKAIQDGRLLVLDGHSWIPEFGITSSSSSFPSSSSLATDTFESTEDGLSKVCSILATIGKTTRVTVIIDSLDELADRSKGGAYEALKTVSSVLGALNGFSRLVTSIKLESAGPRSQGLYESVCSPAVWPPSTGEAETYRGTTTVIRVHPRGFISHIYNTYGLRPPSTSSTVASALESEHDAIASKSHQILPSRQPAETFTKGRRTADDHGPSDQGGKTPAQTSAHPQDAQFWEIVTLLTSRGDTSLRMGGSSGRQGQRKSRGAAESVQGWWTQDGSIGSTLEALSSPAHASIQSREDGIIALSDLLPASKKGSKNAPASSIRDAHGQQDCYHTGLVLLEARHRTLNGRLEEEILACSCNSQGRLRLHALDTRTAPASKTVTPQHSAAGGTSGSATDPTKSRPGVTAAALPSSKSKPTSTSSTSSRLTFNLGETEEQQARRSEVPLPYAHMQSREPIMFEEGRMGIVPGSSNAHTTASLGGARRGHTGNSTILFQPESDDDEDDEDPDDDLDF
ncbi:hypothetical protein OC846_004959 [Tilletia horrida]|uniref:Elongator complex protein 5 n=1 Tax=Tilletia horrida TaxID=155126 RepID=A0AAN6GMQ9_9BASI|nr:hypothetical protein OC845_004650 [Tilletia horrida]KAK0547204.1 hypothetical protein OC846_004959 [Tilletia horrida]KAK0563782.1 hypothetical protein OC861_004628 [Tilletia horrida]